MRSLGTCSSTPTGVAFSSTARWPTAPSWGRAPRRSWARSIAGWTRSQMNGSSCRRAGTCDRMTPSRSTIASARARSIRAGSSCPSRTTLPSSRIASRHCSPIRLRRHTSQARRRPLAAGARSWCTRRGTARASARSRRTSSVGCSRSGPTAVASCGRTSGTSSSSRSRTAESMPGRRSPTRTDRSTRSTISRRSRRRRSLRTASTASARATVSDARSSRTMRGRWSTTTASPLRFPSRHAGRDEGRVVKPLAELEVWFAAGTQEMYGDAVIAAVETHAREVAGALDGADEVPVRVCDRGVVLSPESIRRVCLQANADDSCVGLVIWMHTFSPAKMWIAGLSALRKPILHLHTQFNRELPWAEIDMDFMNLNQSAHGDRELGFMQTRMGVRRKTVVGHWSDPAVVRRLAAWTRAACGWHEPQQLSVARFGDNMRQVAVTEGDKVEAQLRLGVSVNGYGSTDHARAVDETADADVDALVQEYDEQ